MSKYETIEYEYSDKNNMTWYNMELNYINIVEKKVYIFKCTECKNEEYVSALELKNKTVKCSRCNKEFEINEIIKV